MPRRPVGLRHRGPGSLQRSLRRTVPDAPRAVWREWRVAASVAVVAGGLVTAASLSVLQPQVDGRGWSADAGTSARATGPVDGSVSAALRDRATRVEADVSRSNVRPPTAVDEQATKIGALPVNRQALVRGITRPVAPAAPRAIASSTLADYGWGSDQFSCLEQLWVSESDWNPYAENSSSGAYGIPQALPPQKMASAGADWRSNPATQITWGLKYIRLSYGTPCGAWAFKLNNSWY